MTVLCPLPGGGIISTIAGTGVSGYNGDGIAATLANLHSTNRIVYDRSGNLYIADAENHRIRKVSTSGLITTIAGTGTPGFNGDGVGATLAQLNTPRGLAIDTSGNIYIADDNNQRIRKINTSGIISTIAGNGSSGFSGDGGPATNAGFLYPECIAIDNNGNIYITDAWNQRVRKINASGVISTFAGSGPGGFGTGGFSGDGGAASSAQLLYPTGVNVDNSGNVYISDNNNNRIRMVNSSGIISTIAGNGSAGYSGDGGSATAARLYNPSGITFDRSGNMYIADNFNHRIRKVDASGIITTIAGTGTASYTGDGGAATLATLTYPACVTFDNSDNLIIADYQNHAVRKVGLGLGPIIGPNTVCVSSIATLTNSISGGIWTSSNSSVTTVGSVTGIITGITSGTAMVSYTVSNSCGSSIATTIITVNSLPNAGTITGSSSLNTGSTITLSDATSGGVWSSSNTSIATVGSGTGLVTGIAAGNVVISYSVTNSCGNVSTTKTITVNTLCASIITTIAGNGGLGFTGDEGAATLAMLNLGNGVIVDNAGNIFFSDHGNHRIRKVNTSGVISTVAGNGSSGYNGDGIAATNATLFYPCGFAIDSAGNLYIADRDNYRIRKVSTSGVISTVAGTGIWSYSGDGGAATNATLGRPSDIKFDGSGNLFIADNNNNRIRKVSISGVITTVAGTGSTGYFGDGGAATNASFDGPGFIAIDATGNIYISDVNNRRVRKLSTTGILTTFAGSGISGYSGDGGLATNAGIIPTGIGVDHFGNVYIGDYTNNRIRKINPAGVISTFAGNGSLGFSGDGGIATSASLNIPLGIGIDLSNNVYVSDLDNERIRKISGGNYVSPITGTSFLCVASTINLTTTTTGGTWSSSNASVATIGSTTGIVTGLTSGTTTISYTVSNACGSASATITITVNPFPNASTITGATSLCAGSTTTLTDAITGGSWSSTNTAVANVGSTGVVLGVSSGTTIISYAVSNACGSSSATKTITVNPLPNAGTITGSTSLCASSITTLSDATTGGTWTSTNTSVATIGSTGILTGVTSGTTIISYTVSNTCGSASTTKTITVNPLPNAGTITGLSSVNTGSTITLSDAATGGRWSSNNTSIATIGSSTGVVTGVTAGTTTISYSVTNSCGTSSATKTITVNTTILPITGAISLCIGNNTTLTDATPGGTWSSSNTAVATIGLTTGIVNGISTGTSTITYTVSGAYVTSVISVISTTPPISGSTSICVGASTSLTNAAGGGTWTSSVPAKATIDLLSGYVTGVAAGTTIITYSVSCGMATQVITVLAAPAVITGSNSICQGATTTLADATSGGTWSSSNTAIATIGSTGLVTGVLGGTVVISYTISTGCAATVVETVNSLFLSTGITTVCMGATTVLNNPSPGGLWSSSNTAVATVNCNLGIVKGLTPGTTIITYTLGSGCNSTIRVTVISLSKNTGTTGVCVASTTTLSNTSAGGMWRSNNSSIASVDSISGVVTGISTGNAIITYTFGPGCATNTGITVVTLSSNSGTPNVCIGGTSRLNNVTAGGTWISSNTGIASVVATTGVITGVNSGTALITYKIGNTCTTTTPITVNTLPAALTVSGGGTFCNNATITASGGGGETIYFQGTISNGTSTATPSTSQVVTSSGTYYFRAQSAGGCWGPQGSVIVLIPVITGPSYVCPGTTTTLAISGGVSRTWSSSNPSVGIVNESTGVFEGISSGTTIVSDTLLSGCVVSMAVTVGSAPSINGATVVCNGQSIILSNTATGGTWSSSAPTVATVGSTGIVTGVAAGNRATITYSLGATCRSTLSVSVTANNPISVTGGGIVCVGQTTTLSNTNPGGTWSSSDGSIATVAASTGVVTGVSFGTALISYTLSSGCITTAPVITKILSPITGPATVCVGQTITLVDTTDGGLWSTSAPTIATVGSLSGIVSGVAGNLNATLTYTLGTGCKATKTVSVNPLTAIAGYTGTMCQVCQGLTITLTNATTGGAWSSADPTIGSFSTGGIFNGLIAGIVTVSYTLPTGCITTLDAIVNPVAPIVGPSTVCLGQTMQLTESAGAGTWSSSSVSIATVGTTGIVKGIAANLSVTITYTFCTSCKTTKVVTVNPLAVIAGATSVCQGLNTTMTDATVGGTWSSSASGVLNFASTNGNVTGVSAGTATISYILPTGCTSAMTMTVNPLAPIAGPNGVCYQKTIGLTDLVPGGVWSSASATIASVVATTGIVTGATGTNSGTTITYTTSAGCKATKVVSVYALPAVPPAIVGPATVSISGTPITLTNTVTGGTWSSGNIGRATVVSTSGVVTGVGLGTVIITYTVSNAAGCTNKITKTIAVGPAPPPHTITAKTVSINVDGLLALNETIKGGMWSCDDCDGIVGLHPETGTITGIGQGRATITYTVIDDSGTSIFITRVVVKALPESVITLTKEGNVYLIPNPNKGEFIVKGNFATIIDEDLTIEIVDILGQTIYKGNAKAFEGKINEQVVLSNTLANGMYLLNLHSNVENYVFHFVVER